MPRLGLGIGIDKVRNRTPLQLLLKYTSAMWLPLKATGSSEGINSPFTNPLIDLKGVVGKNLFDVMRPYNEITPNTTLTFSGNGFILAVNIAGQFRNAEYAVQLTPLTQYTLKFSSTRTGTSGGGVTIHSSPLGANQISGASSILNGTWTFVTTATGLIYFRFQGTGGTSEVASATFTNIQLELGSVATAYEPYGKANLLLQGFASTTSSGYVGVLCPNGRTVPFLKFDQTNDYGIANHPSLDITGTGDFAIECVFKTDATLVNGWIVARTSGIPNSERQYALATRSTGGMIANIGGGPDLQILSASLLQPNSIYKGLFYRKSGVLKFRLQDATTYNTPDSTTLISKSWFRIGAFPSSETTNVEYSNVFLGHLSITNGAINPFTEAELISKFDKFTMQTFGI